MRYREGMYLIDGKLYHPADVLISPGCIVSDAAGPGTPWWKCPNEPPCGHGGVVHDVEDGEDTLPRCCVEGCPCGERR